MTRKLIDLSDHPSNRDPTAVLVSSPRYQHRDIYRVRGGYVATMNGRAFVGLFPTEESARTEQATAEAGVAATQILPRGGAGP